ncbi:MAG: hypothetical protein ACAI25_18705 [Planctomycetota bacterium]
MSDPLAPLVAAVRISRDAHLRFAAILAFGGCTVGAIALGLGKAELGWAVITCGILFGLFSFVTALPNLRVENARIVRLFRDGAPEVAWIYVRETEVRAGGVRLRKLHDVSVHLNDGSRRTLGVHEEQLAAVLACMREAAPNAMYGFTPENCERFWPTNG